MASAECLLPCRFGNGLPGMELTHPPVQPSTRTVHWVLEQSRLGSRHHRVIPEHVHSPSPPGPPKQQPPTPESLCSRPRPTPAPGHHLLSPSPWRCLLGISCKRGTRAGASVSACSRPAPFSTFTRVVGDAALRSFFVAEDGSPRHRPRSVALCVRLGARGSSAPFGDPGGCCRRVCFYEPASADMGWGAVSVLWGARPAVESPAQRGAGGWPREGPQAVFQGGCGVFVWSCGQADASGLVCYCFLNPHPRIYFPMDF